MNAGPDIENLFYQAELQGFPYREFHAPAGANDLARRAGSEPWQKSLETLRRQWERAAASQAVAAAEPPAPAPVPERPAPAPASVLTAPPADVPHLPTPVYRPTERPRLDRLFRRDGTEPQPGDTPLDELFARVR